MNTEDPNEPTLLDYEALARVTMYALIVLCSLMAIVLILMSVSS